MGQPKWCEPTWWCAAVVHVRPKDSRQEGQLSGGVVWCAAPVNKVVSLLPISRLISMVAALLYPSPHRIAYLIARINYPEFG